MFTRPKGQGQYYTANTDFSKANLFLSRFFPVGLPNSTLKAHLRVEQMQSLMSKADGVSVEMQYPTSTYCSHVPGRWCCAAGKISLLITSLTYRRRRQSVCETPLIPQFVSVRVFQEREKAKTSPVHKTDPVLNSKLLHS